MRTPMWSREKVDRLRHFVSQPLTAGEIGVQLGISRSAVIGKASRLGLTLAFARLDPHWPRPKPEANQRSKPKSAEPPSAPATVVVSPVHILDLARQHCRYPLWADQEQPTFMFCGAQTIDSSSWCATHLKRVSGPGTSSERRATSGVTNGPKPSTDDTTEEIGEAA